MNPLKIKYTAFEAEKDVFRITHDEVGMKLLKKWMFPESLLTAVGYHHRPQEADKKSNFPIIVHVADILTHVYEMQAEAEEGEPFEANLFYGDAIKLSKSFGMDWDVSDLSRFQQTMTENIEKEADTIKLFF
jgi:HD-like signal output (HDOD) protein